ncbi:hypothetical protein S7711_10872 [Stachybotrys chartarum IBT 7711]|uniref:Uncharacterized protein n=1 Tax=Stachybotrys chartarum (strain CBS 109288 / IBT 7711) TaxID=1280523 RepID=A0A084B607_STACB|nr:hypothetical protein S7711_10872 [Stachybotrys chartarum IBT 7711]
MEPDTTSLDDESVTGHEARDTLAASSDEKHLSNLSHESTGDVVHRMRLDAEYPTTTVEFVANSPYPTLALLLHASASDPPDESILNEVEMETRHRITRDEVMAKCFPTLEAYINHPTPTEAGWARLESLFFGENVQNLRVLSPPHRRMIRLADHEGGTEEQLNQVLQLDGTDEKVYEWTTKKMQNIPGCSAENEAVHFPGRLNAIADILGDTAIGHIVRRVSADFRVFLAFHRTMKKTYEAEIEKLSANAGARTEAETADRIAALVEKRRDERWAAEEPIGPSKSVEGLRSHCIPLKRAADEQGQAVVNQFSIVNKSALMK